MILTIISIGFELIKSFFQIVFSHSNIVFVQKVGRCAKLDLENRKKFLYDNAYKNTIKIKLNKKFIKMHT